MIDVEEDEDDEEVKQTHGPSKKPKYWTGNGRKDLDAWDKKMTQQVERRKRDPVIIRCDIKDLNWQRVMDIQLEKYGSLFDVILIDPPWKYHVETDYKLLEDKELAKNLPLDKLRQRWLPLYVGSERQDPFRDEMARETWL